MKTVYDLAELDWKVAGFSPYMWENRGRKDIRSVADPDVPPVPAAVPGSVQLALLKAGVIEDWNTGLNARRCEWVENRQWVYQASLPDKWFAGGGFRASTFSVENPNKYLSCRCGGRRIGGR